MLKDVKPGSEPKHIPAKLCFNQHRDGTMKLTKVARREFQAEVQGRAQLELNKATQFSRPTQKQLPELATLPRTTTGKPIGPSGQTGSQPQSLPQTTTGKPIGPADRSQSRPKASATRPGTSPKVQVHKLLVTVTLISTALRSASLA